MPTRPQYQIDYRWRKARKQARLTPENGYDHGVRLKDPRHTFAAHYGDLAGLMDRSATAERSRVPSMLVTIRTAMGTWRTPRGQWD